MEYPQFIHPDLKPVYIHGFGSRQFQTDLVEFPECPTRSPEVANKLQIAVDNPVGGPALAITCDFALGSGEGDEFGLALIASNESPRTISGRMLKTARYALSGFTIEDYWRIIWRFLAWGDCFANVIEDSAERLKPILLPTWQIHLECDEWNGEVIRATQGRPGMLRENYREIDLRSLVHWCYRKNHLYGRSIYHEVAEEAEWYRQNSLDIMTASREAALVPNIHLMPEGADSDYLEAYKRDHMAEKKRGPIADIYLRYGAGLQKPFGGVAQFPLNGMLEAIRWRRVEIAVASRVPMYLLGIDGYGVKGMALAPGMAFRTHVGWVRLILAQGLRQCIDRYLMARDFKPPFDYHIQFPRLDLNVLEQVVHHDTNAPGIHDTDGTPSETTHSQTI